jgi:hypothetical protein
MLTAHTQKLLVFQIIIFCKTNSCYTHKKIGKNKSLTPHVYHVSYFNFIMFEEIDKLYNLMYFGVHRTLYNLLLPSMHIGYLYG